MTRRGLGPGAVALLVVLLALGLGSGGVAVIAALDPAGGGLDVEGGADRELVVPAARDDPLEAPAGPRTARVAVAREILREWDRRRSQAWTRGDERALAGLYARRSGAGRRDVALLRRWNARAARVTRLQPQVLALRVVADEGRRLVVRVTDRIGVLQAQVEGREISLPRDQPTTRVVTLRRGPSTASTWRVVAVREVAPPEGLSP